MAIGYPNYTGQITPADSDFLDGSIKDDPGNYTGTDVNRNNYNDIHEFFHKLMRMTGITPNGLFDNEYNKHQFVEAVIRAVSFASIRTITGVSQSSVIESVDLELVNYDSAAASGHVASMDASTDFRDFPWVKITNNSSNAVTVQDHNSGTVNGGANYSLAAGDCREFVYDSANTDWIVA